MTGLREAGLVGVTLALAGGVAYIIWTYVSSEKNKPKSKDSEKTKETKETVLKAEVVESQTAAAVTEAEPAEEPQVEPVERGKQVLVLGLAGAGKTSLLHCFASGSLEQKVSPTEGFNAVSINKEELQIEFLEIGGTENLRAYWTRYMPKAVVLVFVVDSSRADQFTLAREHLHELIASDPQLPLVVLAHKQDKAEACSITELHEALALDRVGERKLFLIATHVKQADQEVNTAVQDARDLIIQLVSDGR